MKGPPFFLWVGGEGCFKKKVVFGVKSGLCTLHFPLQQFTFHEFFLLVFGGHGVKAKSSQVSDMFPKEFIITPHFYPICFGKCCPAFTYIPGPKGRSSRLHNRTFHLAEATEFFCSLGVMVHCKKTKIELGRHLI